MQTTLKHEKGEFLHYIGLGASKALLLYPFWCFKSKGTKSTTAFGGFKTPRGWGWHLGLFGFQVFEQKTSGRQTKTGSSPEQKWADPSNPEIPAS